MKSTTREVSKVDVTLKGISEWENLSLALQRVIFQDNLPENLITAMAETRKTRKGSDLKNLIPNNQHGWEHRVDNQRPDAKMGTTRNLDGLYD